MAPLVPLGQVLIRLQSQSDWQKPKQFMAVLEHWTAVVGAPVARHAQPQRLSDGILWVAVSSPVWSQELSPQRLSIKDKLLALVPQLRLRDIRFSPAGWNVKPRALANLDPVVKAGLAPDNPISPFNWPPTDDPKVRLQQVTQVVQWHLAQWSPCPRCSRKSHPAALQRWKICGECHLIQTGCKKS